MIARDASAAAQAVVGDGLEARVLEPSPPAVPDPAWLADDPVQGAGPAGDRVVAPVPLGAARTWETWLADAEPYLYVLPSEPAAATGEPWNATSFTGAILSLGEFVAAADQRAAALWFMHGRRDALA